MGPGNRALAAEAALFLTAAIWGLAFVAQRRGMDHMGPFLFNGLRFALGCLPLIPFLLRSHRRAMHQYRAIGQRGLVLGLILFGGASLQQVGIIYTSVGKAGFITGLYVVLVPVLDRLFGARLGYNGGASVGIAAAGLYLLTLHGNAASTGADTPRTLANIGDALMLACALFWALHILAVGRWATHLPWPQLACAQFFTCSVASLITAAVTEQIDVTAIANAALPLLYAGLLSVGFGYTMQVIAQRQAPVTPAAIIMSLETVFAVLGGWWLLGEKLGITELIGCALMMMAMVLVCLRGEH